jgi:CheY-like chemotaxis protein
MAAGSRRAAAESGWGQSSFVVKLPAIPVLREEQPPARQTEPVHKGPARVIVVEDNRDAAGSLAMLLQLLGHHVRVVHEGVAAIDIARTDMPDVMLIDIGLPGMNGYEVARRIRQNADLKKIVLVALTGYARDEDRQNALATGFDHHFAKPLNFAALRELVDQLGHEKQPTKKSPAVH